MTSLVIFIQVNLAISLVSFSGMHIFIIILSSLAFCIYSAPTKRIQIKKSIPEQLEKNKSAFQKCKAEISVRKYEGVLTVRNVKEAISLRNTIDNCVLIGKKVVHLEEEMTRLTRNPVQRRDHKKPMNDAEVATKSSSDIKTSMNELKKDRKLLTKFITSGGDQAAFNEKKAFSLKKPLVQKIMGSTNKKTRIVKNTVALNVIGGSELHKGLGDIHPIAPHVITL